MGSGKWQQWLYIVQPMLLYRNSIKLNGDIERKDHYRDN